MRPKTVTVAPGKSPKGEADNKDDVRKGPPAAPASNAPKGDVFSFAVIGDMPYRVPQDFPKFDRLIERINAAAPAFTIHIGDIKSSSEPCTDEYFKTILGRFNRFKVPLVYTPGDNEWTDCHRERAGRYDPRERLKRLREIFYAEPEKSLGTERLAVEPQGLVQPDHGKFVENVRFWRNGVLFATIHVVGSNNGFETSDPAAATEFFGRNAANVAWLDATFKLAREQNAAAVVVAMQASLYDIRQKNSWIPPASGFFDTVRALERGIKAFGKPVLVAQGDEHEFEIMGLLGSDLKRIPNAWRMQVMGDTHVHGVMVTVDPASPGVFAYAPLIVPENGPQ
jgi:hypothetical protein